MDTKPARLSTAPNVVHPTCRYMPMFYHIVTVCDNGVIGYNGGLPWKLTHAFRWYRKIVGESAMIMGHKTFREAKPVFDRERVYVIDGRRLSLREALTKSQDEEQVFIMGGESLYRQTVDLVKGIWVRRVYVRAPGDVFYPGIPRDMKRTYSYIQAEDKCHGKPKVALHYYEREWQYA